MRMIGHLQAEAGARAFGDYLYAQGIGNRIEPARDGTWELWVEAEDQIATATVLLKEYQGNPGDPKYQQSARVARQKREQEQQANEAAQKRFFDRRKLFPFGGRAGLLTGILIAISVTTSLVSGFGEREKPILWMFISERIIEGGVVERLKDLPEIRHGEVWRLFTPIFIHFGILHILFNMLWLRDLGSMIESRQSSWHLAVLVIVISACSNVAQFYIYHGGPAFGGMSGVVYGLLGYVWIRGKFDPGSGLYLHSHTVMMMIIWFFACLTGILGQIANTAHAVGLIMGMAWGYLSS